MYYKGNQEKKIDGRPSGKIIIGVIKIEPMKKIDRCAYAGAPQNLVFVIYWFQKKVY